MDFLLFCWVGVVAHSYSRVVRFGETDAGGVVYFAELLGFCHEAYEAALARAGVDVRAFFSAAGVVEEREGEVFGVAVPIVRTEADFFRPMFCGDRITISLVPQILSSDSFEVVYEVFSQKEQTMAKALTRHVSIRVDSRRRCPLPICLINWLILQQCENYSPN